MSKNPLLSVFTVCYSSDSDLWFLLWLLISDLRPPISDFAVVCHLFSVVCSSGFSPVIATTKQLCPLFISLWLLRCTPFTGTFCMLPRLHSNFRFKKPRTGRLESFHLHIGYLLTRFSLPFG
jgi:hypothetical protein